MSYEDLLLNTCTVRRYTEGVADAYGHPARIWGDHLTDEPCRLMASAGRELTVGAEVVVADYKLFLNDIDITEQDRVIISDLTYEVLLVSDRQDGIASHHKECLMRIAR